MGLWGCTACHFIMGSRDERSVPFLSIRFIRSRVQSSEWRLCLHATCWASGGPLGQDKDPDYK